MNFMKKAAGIGAQPMALHPVNPPLGVHPEFCVQVPTTLVLKEKAFSFSGVCLRPPPSSRERDDSTC